MDREHEQAARTRGYRLWQEGGSTHGHDREDWSRAETEIEAAEGAGRGIVARPAEEGRRNGTVVPPWTPVGLFFTVAEFWIETGRTLAAMSLWPGAQARGDGPPATASDGADEAPR